MKKVMENSFKLIIICLLAHTGSILNAQESLPSDTFKIIKAYQPILKDANKKSFEPQIDDKPVKLKTELDYSFH